jgi:hypothetical protein
VGVLLEIVAGIFEAEDFGSGKISQPEAFEELRRKRRIFHGPLAARSSVLHPHNGREPSALLNQRGVSGHVPPNVQSIIKGIFVSPDVRWENAFAPGRNLDRRCA